MRLNHIKRPLFWAVAITVPVLAAACAVSGVSQSEFSAVKDQLAAKEQEVSQLKAASGSATTTVIKTTEVQAGQLIAPVTGAAPTGWDTAESIRGGLHLVATYDSSGVDAWDATASPLVYITSDGTEDTSPTYDATASYFAGFHIVDAATKQVVKGATFNVGQDITRHPHGVCVSPDGKWAYTGWGQKTADGKSTEGVAVVVNMRTLKIDKLFKQESYNKGVQRSQNLHHVQAFKDSKGNDRVVLMWGFGADGGPITILDPKNDNKVVKTINYDDVAPIGHPFTTNSPDGKYLYVSMGANWIREAEGHRAAIGKVNLETGALTVIEGVGSHPIGITHTMDGKYTYVADGTGSLVFKIDNATNKVVAETSAGVAGPYGLAFGWDEKLLYVIGKGEGSHNLGYGVGVIDTKTFKQAKVGRQLPIALGGSASSIDHGILHPDPAKNELWISNMNGWGTIVLDLTAHKYLTEILTPSGGNTHSGGFVRYNPDWTGELLADQGGPKGKTMMDAVKAKVAAAAAN